MSSPLREAVTAVCVVVFSSIGIAVIYTAGQSKLMVGEHRVERTISVPRPQSPSAKTPKQVETLLTAAEFQEKLKQSFASNHHEFLAQRVGSGDENFARVEPSAKDPAELLVHVHVLGYSSRRLNWLTLSMDREADTARVIELNDDLLAVVEADVKSLVASTAP